MRFARSLRFLIYSIQTTGETIRLPPRVWNCFHVTWHIKLDDCYNTGSIGK